MMNNFDSFYENNIKGKFDAFDFLEDWENNLAEYKLKEFAQFVWKNAYWQGYEDSRNTEATAEFVD